MMHARTPAESPRGWAALQLDLFARGLPPSTKPPTATKAKSLAIHLGARIITYQLNPRCRRLSMSIDERGLRVGAPRHLGREDIERFIRQHAAWVMTKLDHYVATNTPRHLAIRQGSRIPVLGTEIEVEIVRGANRIHWLDNKLQLMARPEADVQLLTRRALMRRALEVFSQRLRHYAIQIGTVSPPPLHLSSARTRWGSCSQQSGIRLNWRLIHLPLAIIDYVVVHELAHLREMNHSTRFWRHVESIYPDWRHARDQLKQLGKHLPLL